MNSEPLHFNHRILIPILKSHAVSYHWSTHPRSATAVSKSWKISGIVMASVLAKAASGRSTTPGLCAYACLCVHAVEVGEEGMQRYYLQARLPQLRGFIDYPDPVCLAYKINTVTIFPHGVVN